MAHLSWLVAGTAVVVLAACSAAPMERTPASPGASPSANGASVGPDATAQPNHRAYGPDFPGKPPGGALVQISGAFLSHDRRTLTIDFTGGPPYTRSNPCASDYEGWAGIEGDELVVQVDTILHRDHETLAPNVGCTMEGYGYIFELHLPLPFMGTKVRDRASGPIWVAPPARMAELAHVPAGWTLFQVYSSGAAGSEAHELARGYGPGPGPGNTGQFLFLAQVFDGPVDREIDSPLTTAVVHGQAVPVGRNGDAGYMVNWVDGTDGLTLSSYDPALTLDAFIAIANGVAIPGP